MWRRLRPANWNSNAENLCESVRGGSLEDVIHCSYPSFLVIWNVKSDIKSLLNYPGSAARHLGRKSYTWLLEGYKGSVEKSGSL